jgi:hypothetical protein
MSFEPTELLIPSVHVATLVITGLSALYVGRQKTNEYVQVRNLLVIVHLFYMGVVSLELLRYFVSNETYLTVYTITGTNLVLVDVFLLTLVALALFYRSGGRALSDVVREAMRHRTQATLMIAYGVYILIAGGYLAIGRPFSSQYVPNIVGALEGLKSSCSSNPSCSCSPSKFGFQCATLFEPVYLDVLLGVLLIFMAYPTTLLLLARSRSTDHEVRTAYTILPIAWVAIGLDLLYFNGYLLNQGIDASAVGYLGAAAAFAVTAATFRRATLLSAFFQADTLVTTTAVAPAKTFSSQLGLETDKFIGRRFLLEADPSFKYEESIRDLALELGARQYLLFAFTSKGSTIYNSLSGLENVRFFTMTTKVSYPRPGDLSTEVLVPANDQSVLLNVLDKAITTNPNLKFGVVFDSITDLILSSGLETTYKFLKQANEMTSSHAVTTVFLMTAGAHNEREVSIVKSLFSNQILYRDGQLSIQKTG